MGGVVVVRIIRVVGVVRVIRFVWLLLRAFADLEVDLGARLHGCAVLHALEDDGALVLIAVHFYHVAHGQPQPLDGLFRLCLGHPGDSDHGHQLFFLPLADV